MAPVSAWSPISRRSSSPERRPGRRADPQQRAEGVVHRHQCPPLLDRPFRNELEARLTGPTPPQVQLTVDDDLWLAGHGTEGLPNTSDEFAIVQPLAQAGMQVRYLETNHGSGYLHHDKFRRLRDAAGG